MASHSTPSMYIKNPAPYGERSKISQHMNTVAVWWIRPIISSASSTRRSGKSHHIHGRINVIENRHSQLGIWKIKLISWLNGLLNKTKLTSIKIITSTGQSLDSTPDGLIIENYRPKYFNELQTVNWNWKELYWT